jgi:hypothetical protein
MASRRTRCYDIPLRQNKKLRFPSNDDLEQFERFRLNITGMKIEGALYQCDAWDHNYYQHWKNFYKRFWKTYRKSQYHI